MVKSSVIGKPDKIIGMFFPNRIDRPKEVKMISRTWHGIVPIKFKDEFEKYLEETGVKDTKAIRGCVAAFVKIAEQKEYAHFFLCTIWESMESIIEYAGENPSIAVTYPEDDKYGLISDPIVIHLEIAKVQNPFTQIKK